MSENHNRTIKISRIPSKRFRGKLCWSREIKYSGARKATMDPSTARMRALERRKRQDTHLVDNVRITEAQIEALVRKGYLRWKHRNNVLAVSAALEAWLADAIASKIGTPE
jgi:hypothetical protein